MSVGIIILHGQCQCQRQCQRKKICSSCTFSHLRPTKPQNSYHKACSNSISNLQDSSPVTQEIPNFFVVFPIGCESVWAPQRVMGSALMVYFIVSD